MIFGLSADDGRGGGLVQSSKHARLYCQCSAMQRLC